MSFRFRKSIKIAKGVRLNVSKSGLGTSFGTKGARYSVHSSGRRTTSVGIPGSGMGYVSTKSSSSSRKPSPRPSTAQQQSYSPPSAKAPGLFSPAGEKAMWNALTKQGGSLEALDAVAASHLDKRGLALTFSSMKRSSMDGERETALKGLEELVSGGFDPQHDSFFAKYLTSSAGTVKIADGVTAELPVSRELLALTLAELLQEKQQLKEACDVLEALPISQFTMLSLSELYLQRKEYDKVVSLTNGVNNEDDTSALTCVYRGVALRNKELNDAALIAFKEALRFSSRSEEIRHLALVQRAMVHIKLGKKAQAKKDLERVIAEDASFPGATHLLEKLQ
jgi:tetratricopeptide (TPR) repeat protein